MVINGSCSEWLPVNAGVPQGSILGPLLLLLFINDIVEDIQAQIKLFADDTSLYIMVDNPTETATILNDDLDKIYNWSKKWLVNFNAQKTKSMIVSKKVNRPFHPPLNMNTQELQTVSKHKHLGVFFSNNGSWNDHIEYIVSKSYKRINIMRKMKNVLDRFSLEKVYISFVRPILEYADVVWDSQNQNLIA